MTHTSQSALNPPSDTVISAQGLTRQFGDMIAVDHLNLEVKRGEIFGFLGPNGAGKTTTIKMLCGLLPPSSGVGSVVGFSLERERERIKYVTGYMAQHFSLYPDLTALENFRFLGGVYGIHGAALNQRMEELFGRLELGDHLNKQAGQLSGGLKQRLALACALVHRPQLVFLDEPTAGVDPYQRQKLWDLLYDFSQEGTTLFVTTHYLDEAERCHSVGFMLGGKMLVHGPPHHLKERLNNRILGIGSSKPVEVMRLLQKVPYIQHITLYGYELRLFFENPVEDFTRIESELTQLCERAGLPIRDVYPLAPTLEDLFIIYTVKPPTTA